MSNYDVNLIFYLGIKTITTFARKKNIPYLKFGCNKIVYFFFSFLSDRVHYTFSFILNNIRNRIALNTLKLISIFHSVRLNFSADGLTNNFHVWDAIMITYRDVDYFNIENIYLKTNIIYMKQREYVNVFIHIYMHIIRNRCNWLAYFHIIKITQWPR